MKLLDQLENAWWGLPPTIPDDMKSDREFGRYYKHVSGKHWNELDVERPELFSECWPGHLPPNIRAYYFAAFLKYCLTFYELNVDNEFADAELPFLCTIQESSWLAKHSNEFSNDQKDIIALILEFVVENFETYGFKDNSDLRERLNASISQWRER